MELTRDEINDRTGEISDASMKVHTFLGPGLLESSYELCLAYEIRSRGLSVTTQYPIRLEFEDLRIEAAYRADLLVDKAIIVELKAVELPISAVESHAHSLNQSTSRCCAR